MAWRLASLGTEIHPAAKLGDKDSKVQISTVIHAMGYNAENIFKSFTFGKRKREDNYDMVLAEFN